MDTSAKGRGLGSDPSIPTGGMIAHFSVRLQTQSMGTQLESWCTAAAKPKGCLGVSLWMGQGQLCLCKCPPFSPQTVEHGFPNQPSALAFDSELRIMAIGTRSGAVKMYPLQGTAFRAARTTCL